MYDNSIRNKYSPRNNSKLVEEARKQAADVSEGHVVGGDVSGGVELVVSVGGEDVLKEG